MSVQYFHGGGGEVHSEAGSFCEHATDFAVHKYIFQVLQ